MAPTGEPPEITRAAEAEAEKLWAAIAGTVPDSVDLTLVKPHVIQALRNAFSRGALLVSETGIETIEKLNRAQRRAKGQRGPIN
jgi:hypothetical protein